MQFAWPGSRGFQPRLEYYHELIIAGKIRINKALSSRARTFIITLPAVSVTLDADNFTMPTDTVTMSVYNFTIIADTVTMSVYNLTMAADTFTLCAGYAALVNDEEIKAKADYTPFLRQAILQFQVINSNFLLFLLNQI